LPLADDPPAVRLVVNADGFGMSPAVSEGTLVAHHQGIVTSTSIIGNHPDPSSVMALLRTAPGLGTGVHLTLVEGAPTLPPDSVPSLVGPEGRFPSRPHEVFLSWLAGSLRFDDVERELDAQVARWRDAGATIDHLDTSFHTGFLPPVGRAVESVARRHGISGIRTTIERPSLAWLADLPRGLRGGGIFALAWLTRRNLGPLRHGPQSWGYIEAGRFDEVRILEIIGRLTPGPHELICHPIAPIDPIDPPIAPMTHKGPGDLAALISPVVRDALARRHIQLCRWSELF
jgi:predicted glycoside hydrolase/deacetylase ChbG (UPF0249 family)